MSNLNTDQTSPQNKGTVEIVECDEKEELEFLGYDDESFACFSGVTL